MKTHHLTYQHPSANQVFVAGTFNDWSPDATPMHNDGSGAWNAEIALPPGRYEYRFVVDGDWADDPQATEVVPNALGSANAVLVSE